MALLQVRSTLLGHRLLCLTALLFNRPVRGLLPKFIGPPMLFDNDESNHPVLIKRQHHVSEDRYSQNFPFLPTEWTVTVEHDDGGPWMHGTIVGHGSDGHCGGSHKIWVTKMVHIITRTKRHRDCTIYGRGIHKEIDVKEQYITCDREISWTCELLYETTWTWDIEGIWKNWW